MIAKVSLKHEISKKEEKRLMPWAIFLGFEDNQDIAKASAEAETAMPLRLVAVF